MRSLTKLFLCAILLGGASTGFAQPQTQAPLSGARSGAPATAPSDPLAPPAARSQRAQLLPRDSNPPGTATPRRARAYTAARTSPPPPGRTYLVTQPAAECPFAVADWINCQMRSGVAGSSGLSAADRKKIYEDNTRKVYPRFKR